MSNNTTASARSGEAVSGSSAGHDSHPDLQGSQLPAANPAVNMLMCDPLLFRHRCMQKRSKGGRFPAEISKEEIAQYFHLPSDEAARQLGIGLTVLKSRCRKLGIQRWPFRKVKQINRLCTHIGTGSGAGKDAAKLKSVMARFITDHGAGTAPESEDRVPPTTSALNMEPSLQHLLPATSVPTPSRPQAMAAPAATTALTSSALTQSLLGLLGDGQRGAERSNGSGSAASTITNLYSCGPSASPAAAPSMGLQPPTAAQPAEAPATVALHVLAALLSGTSTTATAAAPAAPAAAAPAAPAAAPPVDILSLLSRLQQKDSGAGAGAIPQSQFVAAAPAVTEPTAPAATSAAAVLEPLTTQLELLTQMLTLQIVQTMMNNNVGGLAPVVAQLQSIMVQLLQVKQQAAAAVQASKAQQEREAAARMDSMESSGLTNPQASSSAIELLLRQLTAATSVAPRVE